MNSPNVFLTFDDGPHPTATQKILAVLRAKNIKGTFFLTGSNVAKRKTIVKQISDDGHAIGIHAYSHVRSMAFSKRETMDEIQRTEDEIRSAGSTPLKLFRPPFGFFSWNTIAAAKQLGYTIVMWSTLTGDFRRDWPDEKVVSNAVSKLSGGTILVFHDNDLTETRISKVLSETVALVSEQGFHFQSMT
ncbi:MAG TPA: polysaccharide deacetylase family protein [Bacteroidota bacterium]|nr:polysaccharide deacetylase family protein [Bacteroidota bacterium]